MAKLETEAQWLAAWWHDARAGKDTAVRIVGYMKPSMLEYEPVGEAFSYLSTRFAAGESLDDLEVETTLVEVLGVEWYSAILSQSKVPGKIGGLTKTVLLNYRARKQAAFLAKAAENAALLIGRDDEGAKVLADQVITKLSTFHTRKGDNDKPVTKEEITRRALQRMRERKGNEGITMPFRKLSEQTGNLLPGDVVAVTGYSNSGKSLFAANLWRHFVLSGVPVIAFPTEMGLAWHARAVAAHADVPQLVAEREQWERATPDQLEKYELALQELERCPWELVDQPSISVDEIIARASVLRRRWPDQTVVVMVDHMHRLNYGREEADFAVGAATREIRNWAREDEMGGIIPVLLYQPRKPEDDIQLYRPVDGYRIRGKSEVWNEIDFLLSPYRRWVMADINNRTPWGSPGTQFDKDNKFPLFAAPNKEGAKLDDERMYVKIGKRRVGGEGPTVMLPLEAPSGRIYEIEPKPKLVVVGGKA